MDFHLKESSAQREIRALVERIPSLGPRVRQLVKEHAEGPEWWPTQSILFVLRCEIAAQSKTGCQSLLSDLCASRMSRTGLAPADRASFLGAFLHSITSSARNKND
jgi:hypothetical protein